MNELGDTFAEVLAPYSDDVSADSPEVVSGIILQQVRDALCRPEGPRRDNTVDVTGRVMTVLRRYSIAQRAAAYEFADVGFGRAILDFPLRLEIAAHKKGSGRSLLRGYDLFGSLGA